MLEIWVILALISAVLYGLKDILSKKVLKDTTITPNQILFGEFLLGAFLLLLFFSPSIDFSAFAEFWHLLILKAFFLGSSAFLYLSLMSKHEISQVSPLINLSPLFLLVLSAVILNEVISLLNFIGILLILFATYILEVTIHHHPRRLPHKFHLKDLKNKDWGFYITAVVTLLCFSFTALIDDIIFSMGMDPYTNLFYTCVLIVSVLLLRYLEKQSLKDVLYKLYRFPQALGIGLLNITSNLFILFAIAHPASLVSLVVPLRRTSTFFSAIGGGLLFHENHMGKKSIALVIMLVGVFFIVW